MVPTRAIVVAAAVVALAGCGGGGPFSDGADPSCTLIQRLGATAERVERVDVADPEAFQQALDDAVAQYVEITDDLLESGPDELHDTVRALQAAAQQHRFADAVAARAALDDYAARECGLRAPPTSTTTLVVPPPTG